MALWAHNLGVRLSTHWKAMDSAVAGVLVVEAEVEVRVVGFEFARRKGPGAAKPGRAGWVASPSSLSVLVSAIQVEKVSVAWAASCVSMACSRHQVDRDRNCQKDGGNGTNLSSKIAHAQGA